MDATLRRPFIDRKSVDHRGPVWINPSAEFYFVTICLINRGSVDLVRPATAAALRESWQYREQLGHVFLKCLVIMPDHVHVVLSPQKSIEKVVTDWKHFTARKCGLTWERDFFEHRLRSEKEVSDKSHYVLTNPVRAGLAVEAKDWPYSVSKVGWP